MSKHTRNPDIVGYKTPPKHSQFKKGRSGNPRGRPPKYDPAAERKQLKALLGLLATRPDYGFTGKGKGNPKSLNYILWLIKELEIQIRLQVYERVADARTRKIK